MNIEQVGNSLAVIVSEAIEKATAPLLERIALLEKFSQDQPEPVLPRNGRDGADGRDALDIEVLPHIDTTKRYRRNTYASHNGGLWVTRRQSDGMDGWECIVDGVAEVAAALEEGGRFVTVRTVKSSGAVVEKAFDVPTMIYKDLFKEGTVYAKGDVVTWAGHMWVCKQETDAKPVEGDQWRIAVKRGQDGKAAVH
jgi:hypothetical protein